MAAGSARPGPARRQTCIRQRLLQQGPNIDSACFASAGVLLEYDVLSICLVVSLLTLSPSFLERSGLEVTQMSIVLGR